MVWCAHLLSSFCWYSLHLTMERWSGWVDLDSWWQRDGLHCQPFSTNRAKHTSNTARIMRIEENKKNKWPRTVFDRETYQPCWAAILNLFYSPGITVLPSGKGCRATGFSLKIHYRVKNWGKIGEGIIRLPLKSNQLDLSQAVWVRHSEGPPFWKPSFMVVAGSSWHCHNQTTDPNHNSNPNCIPNRNCKLSLLEIAENGGSSEWRPPEWRADTSHAHLSKKFHQNLFITFDGVFCSQEMITHTRPERHMQQQYIISRVIKREWSKTLFT